MPSRSVAVVTGASRGLGRAIATGLASSGAEVVLVARDRDRLSDAAAEIRRTGGKAYVAATDVGRPDHVASLAAAVMERVGTVSILVNAAGVFGPLARIANSDPAAWSATLTVNAVGPYLTCRAFLGDMLSQGFGRIVNVSSAGALHPPGLLDSAYVTSKVALNQFTRHLAAEIEGTGVTANAIHPGDVATDMFRAIRDAAGQLGSDGEEYRSWAEMLETTGGDPPEKAVRLVLELVAKEADEINGQFLFIESPVQGTVPSW